MNNKAPLCLYCIKESVLVGGNAIYPHRKDLFRLKFYKCLSCGAYVGTHNGTTNPLGRLANDELRAAKKSAHKSFDWIWRDGHMKRKDAYAWLAKSLNIEFKNCHIGEFDVEMCNKVVFVCDEYLDGIR